MPVMESKAADVFAFGMFAVEVFTGKIPFEEQKNEAVVLRISQGGRPDMPRNPQAVGLTSDIWDLLESCWQQNPKKRPTMQEVVRKWQGFVGNEDDSNTFPQCVQTAMVISSSSSTQFPTPRDWFRQLRSTEEHVEGSGRRRAKTMATQTQLQPPMKTDAARSRTMSEKVGSRKPEVGRLRTSSTVVRTGLGAIPQSPNSDIQQSPMLDTAYHRPKVEVSRQPPKIETAPQRPKVEVSPPTQVYDPPPSGFCRSIRMPVPNAHTSISQPRNVKNSVVVYSNS